jgi:hypothetical protein
MATRCKLFVAVEPGYKENCANCRRRKGERCMDEAILRKLYLDSKEFIIFDFMMRNNKGIRYD